MNVKVLLCYSFMCVQVVDLAYQKHFQCYLKGSLGVNSHNSVCFGMVCV